VFRHTLLLVILLFSGGAAIAQSPTHTLFAVDLSLSTNDKEVAFEIIRETTLNAPETQSVGLTLFDDTVKAFVTPSTLDTKQVKMLNRAMAAVTDTSRTTSNLAIGIERAIDAFDAENGANLVVFSRGVIDTSTQDPRARFSVWLDEVLLPQATQNDIRITLVIPHDQFFFWFDFASYR